MKKKLKEIIAAMPPLRVTGSREKPVVLKNLYQVRAPPLILCENLLTS